MSDGWNSDCERFESINRQNEKIEGARAFDGLQTDVGVNGNESRARPMMNPAGTSFVIDRVVADGC